MSFDKGKYDQEYNRAHIKRVFIPFNDQIQEDAELRQWLDHVGNKTQYIKKLIRDDMNRKNDGFVVKTVVGSNTQML